VGEVKVLNGKIGRSFNYLIKNAVNESIKQESLPFEEAFKYLK
jgi:hypothetical protein